MNALSKKLKQLREEKEIGQKVLADFLNLSVGTISNYETGTHEPDLDTLCRIADFYGVSADYLLGRTDCPRTADRMPGTIYRKYTFSRFLRLVCALSSKDRAFLAYGLRLLEKLVIPRQNS